MANLIGQIIGWFLNLGKVVTTIIDAIFGTDWTAGLESLQSAVTSWGKNENAITLDKNAPTIDYRATYSGAWDAGYDFGQGIDDKIGGMFDASGLDSMGAFDLSNTLDGIYGNTGDTAANTAATADALDIAEEDLAYLRDIAEREAINRFTTAEIKVEQHNENHISKDADLDGIMDAWANDFAEKLEVSEEGVHEYAEFQGIMGSEQPEIEKAWNTTDDLLDNQFIPTAGNMGLSRWEKILGITPKGTDSLEDRRFRILTRINEELPYTLPQLRNILETLCGKGNYSADVEEGTYQLLVKIGLAAKNNFNDVESLLNRVVPQNMVVTLLQLYNTHAELGRFTHAQLAAYTHNQLRNEVLKNGE